MEDDKAPLLVTVHFHWLFEWGLYYELLTYSIIIQGTQLKRLVKNKI